MKVFDLKAFRKDKNITQKEIAEIFSCNQNFISRIESGIRPLPADKMEILQSVYGDISEYYKEDLEPLQNEKQTKQVQVTDDSLEFIRLPTSTGRLASWRHCWKLPKRELPQRSAMPLLQM